MAGLYFQAAVSAHSARSWDRSRKSGVVLGEWEQKSELLDFILILLQVCEWNTDLNSLTAFNPTFSGYKVEIVGKKYTRDHGENS